MKKKTEKSKEVKQVVESLGEKKKEKKEKKAKKWDLNNLPQKEIEKCSIDLAQEIWPFLSEFFKKRYNDADFTCYTDPLIALIKTFSFFLAYFKGTEVLFNFDYSFIRTYFENPEAIDGFLSAIKDCESWIDDSYSAEMKEKINKRISELREIINGLPVFDDEEEMKNLLKSGSNDN
jgi:hypothetical protein